MGEAEAGGGGEMQTPGFLLHRWGWGVSKLG